MEKGTKVVKVRKMTVQDIVALIKEVEKHGVLWDKTMKEHSSKKLKDFAWENISVTLGFPSDMLKEKWKCLKQMFAQEYKKFIKHKFNDGPLPVKWPYFDSMSFLNQIVTAQNSSSNECLMIQTIV
ncbi:uncharacterized protein LOC106666231 isoform X2 [Cimex lectularius]|uniref:MADF domain-containing protein n=1 Tax=Cimex lectularius TaxID=79782 RepID=A0A8I6RPJ5_CIMLE|nr:uncharacterized protein LOC106666231 isoform X2 [Cimex lectularius]